ncbi:MAG: M81 family metallopeptidase [Planctomycetia bacterium]
MTAAPRRRVGILALLQESNTFLAGPTTLDHFRADLLVTGEAVRDALAGAHHEVGGFFAGLAAAEIEAVPIFAARALPYGAMTVDCLDALLRMMTAAVDAAGPLDGLLVAPHGAAVSEHVADVDGHWLGLLRRRVGAIPIIGTIDPHANLSAAMVAATDALVAYRTNPHVDQRDRGLEAARLMARTLAGEIRPTQAAAFPPLAINIECQNPAAFPCLPHYEAAARLRTRYEGAATAGPVARGTVLSTSIVLGFPYADVPEMGSAAIVVANDDPAAARRHAAALGAGLWQARETFRPALAGIEAALDRAAALAGPVCLLDMGDNVGGGSPADGMALARAILRRGTRESFVCVCDPEAAARAAVAGAGARVRLAVGGHAPEWAGDVESQPVEAEWRVRSLGDGRFTESRPRHGGATSFDQGPTAVLEHDRGLTVMVTSRRMAPFSLEQIRHAGLDPGAFRLLVAKGVHAPVAAYGEVCRDFIRVNTPGVTTADLSRFDYRHRRRPLHPFEE